MLPQSSLVLLGVAELTAYSLQSMSNRVAFFVSGVMIALVPLIVFGVLGVILFRSYRRDVKAAREGGPDAEDR